MSQRNRLQKIRLSQHMLSLLPGGWMLGGRQSGLLVLRPRIRATLTQSHHSYFDQDTQYNVAEATKTLHLHDDAGAAEVPEDSLWMGVS